jgi:hypothetical protein
MSSSSSSSSPFTVNETKIFNFSRKTTHPRDFIKELGRQKLLLIDNIQCSKCNQGVLHLEKYSHYHDKYCLRCTIAKCGYRQSIRHGSFFALHPQIDLFVIIEIIRYLQLNTHHKTVIDRLQVDRLIVRSIHNSLIEKIIHFHREHPVRYPSDDCVEIDGNVNAWERSIPQADQNDQIIHGKMIFGMISRRSKQLVLKLVTNENAYECVSAVQMHAEKGCIILHDYAKAYLNFPGYPHYAINKSREGFKREEDELPIWTGGDVHVNNIESVWREKAEWILHRHGVLHSRMDYFIEEFQFIFNKNRFINLIVIP